MEMQILETSIQTPVTDFLFIKSEYKRIRISLNDILFISGLRDYTQIHLKGKTSPLITLLNLKYFEERLPADQFIRVHRSYIVSVAQIDVVGRKEIQIGGQNLPIGVTFQPALEELIDRYS